MDKLITPRIKSPKKERSVTITFEGGDMNADSKQLKRIEEYIPEQCSKSLSYFMFEWLRTGKLLITFVTSQKEWHQDPAQYQVKFRELLTEAFQVFEDDIEIAEQIQQDEPYKKSYPAVNGFVERYLTIEWKPEKIDSQPVVGDNRNENSKRTVQPVEKQQEDDLNSLCLSDVQAILQKSSEYLEQKGKDGMVSLDNIELAAAPLSHSAFKPHKEAVAQKGKPSLARQAALPILGQAQEISLRLCDELHTHLEKATAPYANAFNLLLSGLAGTRPTEASQYAEISEQVSAIAAHLGVSLQLDGKGYPIRFWGGGSQYQVFRKDKDELVQSSRVFPNLSICR